MHESIRQQLTRFSPRSVQQMCKLDRNVRKASLKGGALLGKGTYGCAVSPSIPCSSDDMDVGEYVSKVFYQNDGHNHQRNEWALLNKIKQIDPDFTFTIEPLDACIVPNDRDDVKQCTSQKQLPQIILRLGGKDLYAFEQQPELQIPYLKFLESLRVFLTGFIKLQSARIVHRDIKPANMLFTMNENTLDTRFFLIDFGLFCKYEDVYARDQQYPTATEEILLYKYPFYPPEFPIIGWISQNHKIQTAQHLLDTLQSPTKRLALIDIGLRNYRGHVPNADIEHHRKQIRDFLLDLHKYLQTNYAFFATRSKDEIIPLIFNQTVDKVDVFGLGTTFAWLLSKEKIRFDNELQREQLRRILAWMKHGHPTQRASVINVLEAINKPIQSGGTSLTDSTPSPILHPAVRSKQIRSILEQ